MSQDAPRLMCPKCLTRLDAVANFCPSCGEDLRGLTPTSDTLSGPWVGKVIDGRYSLVEKLGEGGMGAVYKVEHVRMGKVLALKVLRPDLAIDKKMKQRFHQEARVVSKLSHPNTIQVFDFGELEDGALYIAMEFLPGRDLAWLLRAHGPMGEERAVTIGIQVLASLAEAHELGIIHRDIKPANVMLIRRKEGGDTVKVLDFGIAKLNEGEGRKHITGVADFVGTPAYMSPEQAKGEALDARSDLYSVAAMLFELVTGRGVFDGPTPMSIVSKHMSEPPPRFAHVAPDKIISPGFEAVIRKALSKDRNDRFGSAEEMRHALEKVRRDIVNTLGDYTPAHELNTSQMASREDFDQFERSIRMRRVVAPVLTLVLLAAAGVGGWQFLVRKPAPGVVTQEREPNNEPGEANAIAIGSDVKGMIGTALSEGESDRDVFRVDVPSDMAVTLELSGVPDMNLVLEAFQGGDVAPNAAAVTSTGPAREEVKLQRLLAVDDGRTGAGERVDGLRVHKGPLFVRIQEKAHASEGVRPPRETTQNAYALTVRPAPADERLEDEPRDDKLDTAAASPLDRAIRGFTGTAVPADMLSLQEALSAVDIFRVEEEPGARVFALVVPPEQGKLWVADERDVEQWRKAVAQAARAVSPPAMRDTRGGPVVLPLSESSRGYAVRVQPMWPGRSGEDVDPAEVARSVTPPGSPYFVAFFADRDGGLEGVLDLLQLLSGDEQAGARRKVMEAVRASLGTSPRLAAFNGRAETLLAPNPGP